MPKIFPLLTSLPLLSTLVAVATSASGNIHGAVQGPSSHLPPDRVLILDVDNTLYSEVLARSRGSGIMGIEEQIIANTYKFCQTTFNMSQEEADSLFVKYGSTIEGMRQETMKFLTNGTTDAINKSNSSTPQEAMDEKVEQLIKDYYDQVWPNDFDYTSIATTSFPQHTGTAESLSTGYSHSPSVPLYKMLQSCPFPICFASNSPLRHVQQVKRALGLCRVPADVVTPDIPRTPSSHDENSNGGTNVDHEVFPTKVNPAAFFRDLFHKYPTRKILVDDSKMNLEKACWYGVEGIHVASTKNGGIDDALARAIGHVDREFVFSEINYLKEKNCVDIKSIDNDTWKTLAGEIELADDGILRIADLGSGLLFMLELVMKGREDKASLVSLLSGVERLEYHAYEPNVELFSGCIDKLKDLGFLTATQNDPSLGETHVFFHAEQDVVLYLHWYDYRIEEKRLLKDQPHAIVGCSFADLFDPTALVQSLLCFTGTRQCPSPLVYFPIIFSGTTHFLQTQPYCKSARGWIPSDTHVFKTYAQTLEMDQGHNLEPRKLVEAFERHGGELLKNGRSNWVINKETSPAFWKTMMYFFGKVAAPKLMVEGWDSIGWVERAESTQTSMLVTNVDLLLRLDAKESVDRLSDESSLIEVEEIQFSGPYFVETVKKYVNVDNDLETNQVLVKSIYSLISSGTELKIYRGDFEEAALDVNIQSMADESMTFPLSYGYSSVGRVTHVGSENDAHLIGKLVFTFSPHASHVVVSTDSLHFIPDGIEPEDAIFMPSVETALSLVHDAQVRVGEKVAVYGQGLIGLLVTAILAIHKGPLDSTPGGCNFGTITTLDSIPERLAMSAVVGSSQTLLPDDVAKAGPFDVSIEVSGNERALQSAIDHTRKGGRIIIGSWYGNADVSLKLGIDFHRSHKTIVTSQVSEIPANLSMLWTKGRRFELTWALLKLLRPSKLLTKYTTLSSADDAYDCLNKGLDIAVAFKYS